MKFTKMHGIGNDYIYFNCFEETIKNPGKLSVKLSDRHFGVGGDGIVLILPSDRADFRMRMFNADGSEGKMCGNASRCVGKYLYEKGLTKKRSIKLETLSGIKRLDLNVVNEKVVSVKVNMDKPIWEAKKIPVISDKEEVIDRELIINKEKYNITCISMGNPHCVVFMDNIHKLDLEKLGPYFENNEIFPDRINTEFVEIINDNHIKMRVWERGSGETLACGTGACASVVASVINGYCKRDSDIKVQLLGGELIINYTSQGDVYMEGPAKFVYQGMIEENE
ncbi:MAG: diaminopimelate epimerase [Clostridium sp.]|uniref:Diaminopimelate epimerase n=1 Tax=Clostridium paraputrificum TaxID=29363 RepID=A0A6N2ZFT4_9CLOT|nr:diaminopimelate epimerase [Clostridium sp.]MBS5926917.1 diaminopimelate epimerase [Clostridium sp.]MBS5985125.1 diaminopimelate epimerase [Clostridium sp.]